MRVAPGAASAASLDGRFLPQSCAVAFRCPFARPPPDEAELWTSSAARVEALLRKDLLDGRSRRSSFDAAAASADVDEGGRGELLRVAGQRFARGFPTNRPQPC